MNIKISQNIMELISSALWWIIYIIAIWKAGLFWGVVIGILVMIYGLINRYNGARYVSNLYEK